jgi:hypothetical protein
MLAGERQRPNQRQMERRAKPARRSSRFMYPKTAARRLHQSRSVQKNQNPQNGHLMARFDWGFGAICFGASPVAAVFGSAPGSATSPEHRIHSNPTPPAAPSKQDISTLLGIGHFYFALTTAPKHAPKHGNVSSVPTAPGAASVVPAARRRVAGAAIRLGLDWRRHRSPLGGDRRGYLRSQPFASRELCKAAR